VLHKSKKSGSDWMRRAVDWPWSPPFPTWAGEFPTGVILSGSPGSGESRWRPAASSGARTWTMVGDGGRWEPTITTTSGPVGRSSNPPVGTPAAPPCVEGSVVLETRQRADVAISLGFHVPDHHAGEVLQQLMFIACELPWLRADPRSRWRGRRRPDPSMFHSLPAPPATEVTAAGGPPLRSGPWELPASGWPGG
jgi:hypothetical protein